MKKFTYEVVVPSYNGLFLLKKHLPDVIAFSGKNTRITVVDDGSVDGTVDYLTKNYKDVRCLHHDQNLGFTKSVNLGFAAASSDLVVLINNDVSPTKVYLPPALMHFRDDSVFAVTLNESTSSWPQVSYRGKLQYIRGVDKSQAHFSAWASGGSAIFKRSIWNELGGFDEVFSPGYWEDIDISWRAWKAGYRIIWEPLSQVLHQHESTFNLLKPSYLNLIKQRNELLFNWKNITDPGLRREHFIYLLKHALTHPGYVKVIFAAIAKVPSLHRETAKLTDRQILAQVNQPIT